MATRRIKRRTQEEWGNAELALPVFALVAW
jgi:hypothetical protein